MNLITPDFGLIFWQTVTFIIVLLILKQFAWEKILNTIRDREKTISEALKSAEKARLAIEQLKSNNEILIKEASIERDKILKDAMLTKKSIIDSAKIEVEKFKSKTILNSKIAINREKEAAILYLKNYSADLSLRIAEKLLKRELKSDNVQKDLISNLLKNL
jgi:F-type H+-transporting ATPase subunit b